MAGTTEGRPRPRRWGSIQWRRGRPYAVYRDALTGKQTWVGFDSEEQADAFLAQWAADRKAARVAAKAARVEREARAPQRRSASSSEPWTFGQLLSDWDERHRDGVQLTGAGWRDPGDAPGLRLVRGGPRPAGRATRCSRGSRRVWTFSTTRPARRAASTRSRRRASLRVTVRSIFKCGEILERPSCS